MKRSVLRSRRSSLAEALELGDWRYDARQVAMARYSAVGFEAAAVTGLFAATSAKVSRPGRRRVATVRFAHPFAVVAAAFDDLRAHHASPVPGAETGFHVVATKGFDPTTDLGMIEGVLTGVDFDEFLARPRTSHAVAERDRGERLVLTISDELQAVLANTGGTELSAAAGRWVTENESGDAAPITDLLSELSALARGAIERDERLYCWICV